MNTPQLPPLPEKYYLAGGVVKAYDAEQMNAHYLKGYNDAIAAIEAQGVPDELRKEAKNLSSILAGMGEGSYDLETLYTEDQADGDGFVRRAADLLKLIASAPPAPQAIAPELDVRKIMLAIEPGPDGCGEEAYAKSVNDVVDVLTKMGQELEEWQLGIKRLPAPQAEDDSAASVNDTNAALAGRYFELLKVVEQYEKSGVTCQTFRQFISEPCAECNSPVICGKQASVLQQEPLTDEQIREAVNGAEMMFTATAIKVARAIEAAHGINSVSE